MDQLDELAQQMDGQALLPEEGPAEVGYDQIAAQPQPASGRRPQKPAGVVATLPKSINSQEEWNALQPWQKEAVRRMRSGIQFTPEALGEFASKFQDESIKAQSSQKQLKPKPTDLMKLAEYKTLAVLSDKMSKEINALDSDALGPIDTRWNNFKSKWVGADKKFSTAIQAYNSVKNQILKMRSGAAVTDQEMNRMLSEMGDPTSADSTFKLNNSAFAASIRNQLSDQVSTLKDAGYSLPDSLLKFSEPPSEMEEKSPSQSSGISISEGRTATNPKTGQKLIFRSGAWTPLQ